LDFVLSFCRAPRVQGRRSNPFRFQMPGKLESTVQIFARNSKKIRMLERIWLAVAMEECDEAPDRTEVESEKPNLIEQRMARRDSAM